MPPQSLTYILSRSSAFCCCLIHPPLLKGTTQTIMHFFTVALSLLALIAPLSARPHSEVEVLEQLRGIPNGWTQVGS